MGLSTDVEKLFMDYRWPGNVRELIHTLEHAFVVSRKPAIEMDDLPPEMRETPVQDAPVKMDKETEADEIMVALARAGWNKAKAARLLGISRQTIYRKIKDYNIRNL